MNLCEEDIIYLENTIKTNSKSASGENDSGDDIYFLYNRFLLCNESNLFNLMMARQEILTNTIKKKLSGNIVEFGIMKGAFSFQIMKTLLMNGINKNLYLFDFFENNISMENKKEKDLIEDIYNRVNYKRKSIKEMETYAKNIGFNNLNCIKGNIEKTIEPFLENNNSKFCFVYIDVDVENPTYICLSKIWDRVVKNGIIIIDDYNSKKWGPFKNVDEFLKDKNIEITNLHNSINEGIIIRKL
jgi:hypothetical protein